MPEIQKNKTCFNYGYICPECDAQFDVKFTSSKEESSMNCPFCEITENIEANKIVY